MARTSIPCTAQALGSTMTASLGERLPIGKYSVRLDPKILRESSILRDAVGPQIQAKEKVAAHAIKAFAA